MIKEIVISSLSVIAIVVGNNTTNAYARETMGGTSKKIEELRSTIEVEEVDSQKAKTQIDEIYNEWEEHENSLAFFVEHDELEKVKQGITEIKGNVEMEEYKEATVKADTTEFIINHIQDKLELKLKNIF